MKQIVSIASLLLLTSSLFGATSFSTNIVTKGCYTLLTNAANVSVIELTSDKACLVDFYDQNTQADPYFGTNYATSAYAYRTTYPTNYVTSYVNSTGFTNWYTNAGVWTLTLTNAAATNVLAKATSLAVGANAYAVYPVDLIFNRGISIIASTNVSLAITYRAP